MHSEHCIVIALIVITSLPCLEIHTVSIGHKTLSEAQTTSQIDVITYCLSLLLCSTRCIVSGPHAYYLSVLPKSRAHSIFSLLTHCLSRLHTHWYHPRVLLISLLTHYCLSRPHTHIGIIPVSAPAQLPHTQLAPQARRLEKFYPDLGNNNMNDIPKTEVVSTAFTGTSAAFIAQSIMQFCEDVLHSMESQCSGNSEELPTQNPPLALWGILAFKDRRLLIFFSNSKLPTFYRCICVFL